MKKIKIFIALIMLVFVSFNICFINNKIALAENMSTAKAVCVLDAGSSRMFYSKNENMKLPMASTTKIVTALTVLNNCTSLDKEFKIDNRAIGITGTSIYLKYDEIMTVRELLYGMMLPSGNDAATALAYHISGDITKFCELMQKTANACGAYNSSFENPHGLDSNNHYTTARDLALITAKALENDLFKEIVTTKNTRIRGSKEGTYRYLKNKNRLLNTLQGCIGVKTGYTGNAGRCLVSACERNGFKTVSVVLNCGPMFELSDMLLNNVYKEYSLRPILTSYKIIRPIIVNGGKEESVKTYTKKGFEYPLTKQEFERLVYKYNLPSSIDAPVAKEQIVGTLEIYLDNNLLFSEKIFTMESIKKIGVLGSIKDIISQW